MSLKEHLKIDESMIIQEIQTPFKKNEEMQFANEGQTMAQSKNIIDKKRKFICDLYVMWMSAETIFDQCKIKAKVEGWIPYSNIQTVKAVISEEFKERNELQNQEVDEHIEGLKQAMFAQQEKLIEKASLYISEKAPLKDKDWKITRDAWKPFEYISALKETFLMRQQMIENRNFNDSKKNINAWVVNITNQLNVFVDNSKKIAFWQVDNPALTSLKARLEEKFEKKKNI